MRSMVTRSTCLARYGRSLGFGLALAFAGVAGCGDGGSSPDKKDAKPAVMDGPVVDAPSTPDLPITADTRDALPAVDGADAPITIDTKDAPVVDAPPTVVDARKRDVPQSETLPVDRSVDRQVVDRPPPVDAQPRPDTRKADAASVDGGPDATVDAEQAG